MKYQTILLAAGLGMMLWFDLERVSAKSRLFASSPSWMGLAPGEGYGLVNLGDSEDWRFRWVTLLRGEFWYNRQHEADTRGHRELS